MEQQSNRLVRWLLGTPANVPASTAGQLTNGIFSSVPIFVGGVLNTTAVAAVAALRQPTAPFVSWLLLEILLGAFRIAVLITGRSAIAAGRTPPTALAAALSCAWAMSVGAGTFLCILSGDWVLASIACLSAAAMVCGMCLRNFGTPRLAGAMVLLALGPCAVAGLLTTEPIMGMISVQLPVYTFTILSAAFALHRMLVSWMTALDELKHSKSLNDTILQSSPDHTLILDEHYRIMFCKRPGEEVSEQDSLIGCNWLDLLSSEDRGSGELALANAASGTRVNVVTSRTATSGERRWFETVIDRVPDESGRIILVSRDITHQKKSEEQALWMARHDVLTGLPNRAVLQDRVDGVLDKTGNVDPAAMLVVDVDNFKAINDSLGHDAGDALLCTVAERLSAAVADSDLVARTGGDEFALLVSAHSSAEVDDLAKRIFASLRQPISHGDRLIECSASIGASMIPRDGNDRSQIMKAADLALYAAKAGGRGELRIFEPAMKIEMESHRAMIASARLALQRDAIVPYYQPKICLRSSRIVGFEALLRWRDGSGALQGPDSIEAAFDDPTLGGLLTERMLDNVLKDIRSWVAGNINFDHVAINVTSADFHRGDLPETIRTRLAEHNLPPSCIQIEVTENVFLGRCTKDVEQALQRLSDLGVRIALDDFGTGYASLSHLNQFPVDLLKIDRTFIQRIGRSADADAICSTLISLGHCLGLEVIAEGIETSAQEEHLVKMGCDTGQGFLYSDVLSAAEVPSAIECRDAEAGRCAGATKSDCDRPFLQAQSG